MSENISNIAPTSSTKKSVRKPIVVRQTLTSKLRAERGDKLQFIKSQLEALSQKQTQQNCNSKESLCSDNKFKNPNITLNNDLRTPIQKVNMSLKVTSENRFNKKPTTYTTRPVGSTIKPIIKNKATKTVSTISVSNCQSTKKTSNNVTLNISSLNKPIQQREQPKDDKFKNRLSLMPNQIRTNLSTKFSQSKLPNQIKSTLPKLDEKLSKRQTLMPQNIQKKEQKNPAPVKSALKKVESKAPVNIKKPAIKNVESAQNCVKNPKKTVTMQSPMRKSLTAMHFRRVSNCNPSNAIHRTKSWSNGLSPTTEGPTYRSPAKQAPIFRTPSMAQRRSIVFQTPMSETKSMTPFSILSTPTTSDLKRRLSLWLEKRGQPLDSFHHLRCFGVNSAAEIDEENKENFEVYIPDKNSSYEDLKIPRKTEPNDQNISVANDAMYDLHKLILEGYPREQCEAWLDVICSRFQEVQDRPQYWECRAALEEARGNYQSALDCYTNAVAIGAEVEKVNEALDNLLEKFSVLNISQSETSKPSEQRTKALDARNVFKSSIIGFAIQERSKNVDADGCRFSATPVRRSTRKSRLHYVTRPDVQLYSTLDKVDSSVRKALCFQNNCGFKR